MGYPGNVVWAVYETFLMCRIQLQLPEDVNQDKNVSFKKNYKEKWWGIAVLPHIIKKGKRPIQPRETVN